MTSQSTGQGSENVIKMGIQRLARNLWSWGKCLNQLATFLPQDLDLDPGKMCQSVVGEKTGYIHRADESMNGPIQGE